MFLLQAERVAAARRRRDPRSTSSRSASRSSWPATRGRSRSTSTTSGPDLVIGYGLALGSLSPDQRREPRQPGARRPRGAGGRVHRRTSGRERASGPAAARRRRIGRARRLPLGVVAVVAGEGLAAIFRDFGVAAIVQGGQTSNPSTGELLEAVGRVDAREILILPNNPNVVLAARQVASMVDRPVRRRPDPQRRRGVRGAARPRPDARRRPPTPAR